MQAIKAWLLAGSPAHYITALAILAYAALEWWLPRTKFFKANSTLELLANAAKKALLDRIPLIGRLVKALATPIALLAFALLMSSCAQYSACVKQKTSATFKALTAATVETQVTGLIDLGISEQWVQLGLTAAEDACVDTDCKALVVCVAIAWSEKHPISGAPAVQAKVKASQDGISAYLVKAPVAWRLNCYRRVAETEHWPRSRLLAESGGI